MNPISDAPAFAPDEEKWWEPLRESAYEALARGETRTSISARLHIGRRTLFNWQSHPFWQDRRARDLADRRRAHADSLTRVDRLAVLALPGHVSRNGPVALRYLHLRNLLADGPELQPDSSEESEFDLDDPRDYLRSIGTEVPMPSTPSIGTEVPMPSTPSIGTEVPMPSTPSIGTEVPMPSTPSIGTEVPMPPAPSTGTEVPMPPAPSIGTEVPMPSVPMPPPVPPHALHTPPPPTDPNYHPAHPGRLPPWKRLRDNATA